MYLFFHSLRKHGNYSCIHVPEMYYTTQSVNNLSLELLSLPTLARLRSSHTAHIDL